MHNYQFTVTRWYKFKRYGLHRTIDRNGSIRIEQPAHSFVVLIVWSVYTQQQQQQTNVLFTRIRKSRKEVGIKGALCASRMDGTDDNQCRSTFRILCLNVDAILHRFFRDIVSQLSSEFSTVADS